MLKKPFHLALMSFAENIKGNHILHHSDNIPTIIYTNKMGGLKSKICNYFTNNICQLNLGGKEWISAQHVQTISETRLANHDKTKSQKRKTVAKIKPVPFWVMVFIKFPVSMFGRTQQQLGERLLEYRISIDKAVGQQPMA